MFRCRFSEIMERDEYCSWNMDALCDNNYHGERRRDMLATGITCIVTFAWTQTMERKRRKNREEKRNEKRFAHKIKREKKGEEKDIFESSKKVGMMKIS